MVHSWSMVMRCRFVHVSIVRAVNSVMTAFVGHEHRRTVIVETASVVVSVHCKRPAACLPCYRTIEVGESHILVELPAVQHEAEVCVTAIPPDAEDISVSV